MANAFELVVTSVLCSLGVVSWLNSKGSFRLRGLGRVSGRDCGLAFALLRVEFWVGNTEIRDRISRPLVPRAFVYGKFKDGREQATEDQAGDAQDHTNWGGGSTSCLPILNEYLGS
ncbi:Calpain clp-1 [Fusarium oxysporum f. sp. albedinis]|nr:Calpain clp-1 [Fusarium oxysporum f. sp. albedinis]